MKILLKQAVLLPLYFFIPVLVAGVLADDYSAISQHGSAMTLMDGTVSKALVNAGAILTGASCVLLAFGLLLMDRRKYPLSAVLIALFGISMISNGLYPMGSPMHGFYGMGFSLMILPFAACYELKGSAIDRRFFPVSIAAGFIIFLYLWSIVVGFDPVMYRGLTQRLASVVIFGWLAYVAYAISKAVPTAASN